MNTLFKQKKFCVEKENLETQITRVNRPSRLHSPSDSPSSSSSSDDELSFICHPCQLTFSKVQHLEQHEAAVHAIGGGGDTGSTFEKKPKTALKCECTRCGKRFRDAYGLRRHFASHTGERSIPCNFCEKRFTELNDLHVHLRTHSGEKPYECPICKQRYRQKAHLISHYRTHTGEKPYPCTQCGRCFSTSTGLAKHHRVHIHGYVKNQKEQEIVEVIDSIFG
jgi:uncharacterized Zn-finger protein